MRDSFNRMQAKRLIVCVVLLYLYALDLTGEYIYIYTHTYMCINVIK